MLVNRFQEWENEENGHAIGDADGGVLVCPEVPPNFWRRCQVDLSVFSDFRAKLLGMRLELFVLEASRVCRGDVPGFHDHVGFGGIQRSHHAL